MSVSARIKQYGAMRAVGMDNRQLKRMISAEAYTYAISGLIVGCGIGLPLSRFLYNRLITHYFGIEWRFPILWFGIVVAYVNLPDDGKRKKAVVQQTYFHALYETAALIFRAAVSLRLHNPMTTCRDTVADWRLFCRVSFAFSKLT